MTVMLVGGGTGGHILPLLAVAQELKSRDSKTHIIAVVDKSTNFAHLLESASEIDQVFKINAGKFRRYPNQSITEKLLDLNTLFLNIRDAFRTVVGIFQAYMLISKYKPRVAFIKGGFVGVPCGIGCRLSGTPFITHDSDATPGLANRIIGRWATLHAVAMKKEAYNYDPDKTVQVGIPVSKNFKKVTPKLKLRYREELGVPRNAKLILITGGSQGAKELNDLVASISHALIANKDLYVIHQTGNWKSNDLPIDNTRYKTVEYIDDLYRYSGASDIIISRAGSIIAEFATQYKSVILVPAPQLADGHQLKNAQQIKKLKAGLVIQQDTLRNNPGELLSAIDKLLNNHSLNREMAENLSKAYPSGAVPKIVDLLEEISPKRAKE